MDWLYMPGSHGAAVGGCTVSGADAGPLGTSRTGQPLPAATLRNRSPPSESARWVETVRPLAFTSDAWALAGRPVTSTWSTLPRAVKLGVVARADDERAGTTSTPV